MGHKKAGSSAVLTGRKEGSTLSEKPFSLLSKNFILICLAHFCYFASLYLLLPTLPQYVSCLGGTSCQVGMAIGFFTLASVLARPYFGRLADRSGCKLPLLFGSGFPYRTRTLTSLLPRLWFRS